MVMPLSVGRLVRVSVNLSPLAAARRSFGILLVAGDSDVIDGVERIRAYTTLEAVADDFGTSAPEYEAAALYFGQTPQPEQLFVGRWLRAATEAILRGGILTPTEQAMSNFTSVTNGGFRVTIDGTQRTVSSCDFSAETTLNGVAAIINTKLGVNGSCAWDGSRFVITSATTGTSSTVAYAIAPASGADISTLLKLTSAEALTPVPGFAAETPVECAQALANISGQWYGLTFAASVMPTDNQALDVSAYIEGLDLSRIYGVTITDTRVLDSTYEADLASVLLPLNRKRTCLQYSDNEFAIASLMGRAFSVNFNANKSTITLMYKQEPGIVAENLTETQAQTLKAKRCNVFVTYQNNTAIIQYGVMSGQAYFDEIHGLDWFKDALQNAEYNLLYQSKTKIPQTDAGNNQIKTTAAKVCQEAINNGLVAPGAWNADGFGQIERGDYLKDGYYIFMPPIATQSQADREQRKAVPMQIALKLAGAIQELDIVVDVNR